MRIFLAGICLSSAIFFYGCGGVSSGDDTTATVTPPAGGGGGGGGGVVVGSVSTLKAKVADGPIVNAKLWLASMRAGPLTSAAATTDSLGNASLSVPNSTLMTLQDDDVLYWYAESQSGTQVDVNGGLRNLVEGQMRFRSLVGFGRDARSGASLGSFAPSTSTSTISHFSNAEFTIVESKLGLSEPIAPQNTTNSSLDLVATAIATTERDLADANSAVAKKFKLIAVATKGIVEDGLTQILQGGSTGVENSARILLELGKSTASALTPQFDAALPQLSARVSQDLTSALFSQAFDPGVTAVIQSISTQAIATAAAVPLPTVRILTEADILANQGLDDATGLVVPARFSPLVSGGGIQFKSAIDFGVQKSNYSVRD